MGAYVEKRDGGYYIAGSRVPLDGIVHQYWTGAPVESIRQSFPTLTLEQVHGALAFYHAHRDRVDASICESEARLEAFRRNHPAPARLTAALERARQHAGRT